MTDPSGNPERAEAVRLIRMLAKARQFRIPSRVQTDLEELELDADDVVACLGALTETEIHKDGDDETIKGKRVYVFYTSYDAHSLYVKVSLCLPKDHDLSVVSFHIRSTM